MRNFFESGTDAYSYQTCIRTIDCEGRMILNRSYYSPTTSRHQDVAFKGYGIDAISLNNVPVGATAEDLRNIVQSQDYNDPNNRYHYDERQAA